MSRIGNKKISIPSGVKVEQSSRHVKVSGPLGSLGLDLAENISVKGDNAANCIVVVNEKPDVREARQLHGTARALLANMVEGVSRGFEKKLEVYGAGYTVKDQAGKLILQVGFASPIEIPIPQVVKVKVEAAAARGDDTPAKFTLSSADKCVLGRFAADIRKVRPPEPYKGKGIRYTGEVVKRKVGKTFTSGTTG